MILTTKAIVLDSISYQDSSLIIRLFTESVGKISIIVKGAKKRKNNISLITEPGNIISITLNYKSTKNLQIPSEIDLVYSPPEIRNDIKTLHYVMAIISITDKCCHENEKMYSLFNLLQFIIMELSAFNNNELMICFFLIHVNKFFGFTIHIEECSICNHQINEGSVNLDYLICCNKCANSSKYILSKNTLIALNNLMNYNMDVSTDLSIIKKYLYLYTKKHLIDLKTIKPLISLQKYQNHA